MGRGRFITVEGVEGVGKSTNLQTIERYLRARGLEPLLTREPGGTPLAEDIRRLLLASRDEPIEPVTELLLMYAARNQHLVTVIKPALESGRWVVCDRFSDSSFAYQGEGRGLGRSLVARIDDLVLAGFQPDLTFLLDLPPAEGLGRAAARSEADRFEREGLEFFERVRTGFLHRARSQPDRFRIIDASATEGEVARHIERELARLLVTA